MYRAEVWDGLGVDVVGAKTSKEVIDRKFQRRKPAVLTVGQARKQYNKLTHKAR